MINDLLQFLNYENIYLIANIGVIPCWLLLIFLPNHVITKFFVNVKFASMANIIMGKEIYKEHLQNNATKEQIVASISKIFTDNLYKENLISEIKQINESVGSAGATKKAAKLIEMI